VFKNSYPFSTDAKKSVLSMCPHGYWKKTVLEIFQGNSCRALQINNNKFEEEKAWKIYYKETD
jgi:hypothetical protein